MHAEEIGGEEKSYILLNMQAKNNLKSAQKIKGAEKNYSLFI